MVDVIHESALILESHYSYENQLASMVQTAPSEDWHHIAGILRARFLLPVARRAVHPCNFALMAGFV